MIRAWSSQLKGKALVVVAVALVVLVAGYLLVPRSAPGASSPAATAPGAPTASAEDEYLVGAYSDAKSASPVGESDTNWWEVGSGLFVKFALVVGLIYACVWVLKKTMQKGSAVRRGTTMTVLETTYLAPQRSLHLVSVGGKILVLGSTQTQISLLGELEPAAAPPTAATAADGATGGFASLLHRAGTQLRPRRLSDLAAIGDAAPADARGVSASANSIRPQPLVPDSPSALGGSLLSAAASIRAETEKIRRLYCRG